MVRGIQSWQLSYLFSISGCRFACQSQLCSLQSANAKNGRLERLPHKAKQLTQVDHRLLIQGLSVAFHPDCQDHQKKQRYLPNLPDNVIEPVSLEQDAADNPQKVCER